MFDMQTGGSRKHWLFDPSEVHHIPQIANKLVQHDIYFPEEPKKDDALTYILEYALDQIPAEEAEAIRILKIQGATLREAGRELGIDHKTVKARAKRGAEKIKVLLEGQLWVRDILTGKVSYEKLPASKLEVKDRFSNLVKGSGDE
jgi:DNA-directed RNA polymerase specialized sigma24 family protein